MSRHWPGMELGKWYEQRFSDQIIWFQPTSILKNGGYAGLQYEKDLLRPRANIKVKKSTCPMVWTGNWTKVSEADVPHEVKETKHRGSR
ncbi:MAG: hypothetical protein ACYDH4_11345 [Candidatus Cryosericum sp.]